MYPSLSRPRRKFGTPDNLPPALEDICDMTTGAANGLCVAYCEAMDCDSEDPNASAKACTKIEQKYTAITGEILPCIRTCPCWEPSELNSVTAENELSFASCANNSNAVLAVIQNDGSTPGVEGGFASLLTDHRSMRRHRLAHPVMDSKP